MCCNYVHEDVASPSKRISIETTHSNRNNRQMSSGSGSRPFVINQIINQYVRELIINVTNFIINQYTCRRYSYEGEPTHFILFYFIILYYIILLFYIIILLFYIIIFDPFASWLAIFFFWFKKKFLYFFFLSSEAQFVPKFDWRQFFFWAVKVLTSTSYNLGTIFFIKNMVPE